MQALPFDDPGTPDLRSPLRYLAWVGRGQWGTLVVAIGFGVVWMVGQALFPAAISRAVDQGIVARDGAALTRWSLVLLGLGLTSALAGVMRHRLAVTNWMRAAFRTTQLIGWHAADTGEALPRERPTGDVVAVVASDAMRVGGVFDVLARFVGAIVSFGVVAVLLLTSSTPLGLLVLLGVPTLLGLLGFVVRPLQRRQAQQREEAGRLIGLGADTVAGLRVLRGIGGEEAYLRRYSAQSQQVRSSGYHVAGMQAALDAAQVLLPGLFVLLVTWLGARFAVEGEITVGELVAFYGYSAFLVIPLRTATEFLDRYSRARIGAAKTVDILRVRPDHVDGPEVAGRRPAEPGPRARLHDERSGLVVDPGLLTVVVSARPEDSAALADRLGRFGTDTAGVRLDEVALSDLPVATVRRRVVVSETDPRMFTGTLRDELDPAGSHDDEALLAALAVASGDDVLEALAAGLASEVEERGRSFSGGQRQRLALTRALLTEAQTLVLVEPTSAVDAHTEARIAGRLADARRGRTTVVMSSSPLVLDQADRVVLLHEGRVAATGSHRELMHSHPGYRAVVVRGDGDPA
ncbi:MAG: ABC transporter ATP-binding protein/permease [Actinomycetota bacterium]|nr:ABC transporter ATP-binding protein/permease [Actinomycetota bacterium]